MNTQNWMTEETAPTPRRAKPVRHNRRSTDRRGPDLLDVTTAFAVMALATWGLWELNSLLLR